MPNHEFAKIIGGNVEKLLKERNVSIKELSQKTGLTETRIKGIISCKYKAPKSFDLYKIVSALKGSFDELTSAR